MFINPFSSGKCDDKMTDLEVRGKTESGEERWEDVVPGAGRPFVSEVL